MLDAPKFTYIRDIVPSQKNVNIQFIVLDISKQVYLFNLFDSYST